MVKKCVPGCSSGKFHLDVNFFVSFCLRAKMSMPQGSIWKASALDTFILEDFWNQVVLKVLFKTSNI
jgi:hypothetical protein